MAAQPCQPRFLSYVDYQELHITRDKPRPKCYTGEMEERQRSV